MKDRDLSQRQQRRDRLIRERVHDPYMTRRKLAEPTACPKCGAVYRGGRWSWLPRPDGAAQALCPACHRINDRYPAGEVTLRGGFLSRHRTEILSLARNLETQEKSEHPLHRIIAVEDTSESVVITTTDIHLPRRIGEAIYGAYDGELDLHYDDEGYFIRVAWHRDD